MRNLETTRVYIRHFEEKDLKDIYQYASVEGVGESAGWKHHTNIEETKAILYNFFLGKSGEYAIVDKESNTVIGSFAFRTKTMLSGDFLGENVLEIGYVLSKDFWKKGIMTELVSAVLEALKTMTDFTIVVATTYTQNKASIKVLEKNGFHQYRIIEKMYQSGLSEQMDMYCFYKRLKRGL